MAVALDEPPEFEPRPIDSKLQLTVDIELARVKRAEWQAAEARQRRAEQPAQEAADRQRALAYDVAQRQALTPRADAHALEFEEVQPDPQDLARDAAELERLNQQLASDTITRRGVLIAYDRNIRPTEGLAWAKWEAGVGPNPNATVAGLAEEATQSQSTHSGQPPPAASAESHGRCSVCQSGEVDRITQALASGASLRRTAAEHKLSEAAIRRHLRHSPS